MSTLRKRLEKLETAAPVRGDDLESLIEKARSGMASGEELIRLGALLDDSPAAREPMTPEQWREAEEWLRSFDSGYRPPRLDSPLLETRDEPHAEE